MNNKIRHAERHFSSRVMSRLEADGQSFPDFKAVFAHFRSYDPSRTGAYTTWLIKTYVENGFLFEDLGKAKETLQWFDEVKHRLPVERRNIADYPTLAEVWKAVKPFVEEPTTINPSKREQRRKEQDEVYAETVFLEETDDFRAVIPLTERASKWWGRGTRWCTSARDDNRYWHYALYAPLIIFDFKDGHKWQMWVDDSNSHFMDEDDEILESSHVLSKYESVGKYINHAFSINPSLIRYLHPDEITHDVASTTVRRDGNCLRFLPDSLLSNEDICTDAVLQNSDVLKYVPDKLKTNDFISKILSQTSLDFPNIPSKLRNKNNILRSMTKKGFFLRSLKKSAIDRDICLAAVGQNGTNLDYVPKELRTEEICLKAVSTNGEALQYVPLHLKTKAMILTAIRQDPISLKFSFLKEDGSFADTFVDREICMTAVSLNGRAIQYVPQSLIDDELRLVAIRSNGVALSSIHPKHLSRDLHLEAVRSNGRALEYVPERQRDRELCLAAVESNGHAIYFVPKHLIDADMCLKAIEKDMSAIASLPEEFRSTRSTRNIVEETSWYAKFIEGRDLEPSMP